MTNKKKRQFALQEIRQRGPSHPKEISKAWNEKDRPPKPLSVWVDVMEESPSLIKDDTGRFHVREIR